jgi:DNA-binding transcriptional LysR family regulator
MMLYSDYLLWIRSGQLMKKPIHLQPIHLKDVEIRHLQALQAVAAEGSFGRAAERLGFSQSAISQQIAAFERVLGHQLFDRPGGPRPVELTPVGELLLGHADEILGRLRQAEDEVEALLKGGGRLLIGSFQSVSVKILPAVVGQLISELPNLTIRCVEFDDVEASTAGLLAGELDIAFLIGEQIDELSEIEHTLLCVDPFVLVSPVAALAGGPKAPVATTDVADMALIGEQQGGCQATMEAGLRKYGVEPRYVFRSNDNSAIQAMVRAGMGHAVMPYLAVEPSDPGIVVRDLTPALPPRHIRIARRRGRTLVPAAQRFIDIATGVCAQMSLVVPAA